MRTHPWTCVVLALRGADEDRLQSRLPTHLHPLAGRLLVWHVLRTAAELEPAPSRLLLLTTASQEPSVLANLPVEVVALGHRAEWRPALRGSVAAPDGPILLVDAAAVTLGPSLTVLVDSPTDAALVDAVGQPLALWLTRLPETSPDADDPLVQLARSARAIPAPAPENILVRDRASLADATRAVRERLVRMHMEAGVTFLLPESVHVEVDVRIEPDTVIYPGVVLEGHTTIGRETVIGPGCRIVDASIGSGVELKGWNYVSRTSIRNRAVLEPYVRRGFD